MDKIKIYYEYYYCNEIHKNYLDINKIYKFDNGPNASYQYNEDCDIPIKLTDDFIINILIWIENNNYNISYIPQKLNFYSENNNNINYINITFIKNQLYKTNYIIPYIQFINVNYNFTYNNEIYEDNINIPINYQLVPSPKTNPECYIPYNLSFLYLQNQIVPYILYHKYLKDNNQEIINISQLNETKKELNQILHNYSEVIKKFMIYNDKNHKEILDKNQELIQRIETLENNTSEILKTEIDNINKNIVKLIEICNKNNTIFNSRLQTLAKFVKSNTEIQNNITNDVDTFTKNRHKYNMVLHGLNDKIKSIETYNKRMNIFNITIIIFMGIFYYLFLFK